MMEFKSLDIRGTNGSGKSYIIHTLLKNYKFMVLPNRDGGRIPWGYFIRELNLCVIGSYENVAGGCDTIKSQSEVMSRINEGLKKHNVIFEGLLVSGIFQRWNDWAIDKNHTIGFLDTPYDECIRRVISRRNARGDFRLFNPRNLDKKYRSVCNVRKRFIAAGRTVVDIPWRTAYETVEKLLCIKK